MNHMGHALAAARRGFFVFPVEPLDKTPGRMYPNRSKEDAPWPIKWSEVATNYPPTIVNWWNTNSEQNVGIACKPSQLLVVDCDLKNGDGLQEWADLCQKYAGDESYVMWQTYTVNTGSGGAHFYYGWPPAVKATQNSLTPNVDIRSNGGTKGGYVLAAGSVTAKGSYEPDNEMPVMMAPAWLVALCEHVEIKRPDRTGYTPMTRYARADSLSFGGLVTKVAFAPEGDRNACLLWSARAMCHDGAEESLALELLVPAAVDNGLTEREATDTVLSGYRIQRQKDGR